MKYLDEVVEQKQLLPPADPDDEFGEQTSIDDVLDLEKRGEICCGFDEEIFLEFKLEQLQELKDLAWAKADHDTEERHYAVLHDRRVAREYAVAEYIRQKIRYCNAYPDPVENRYRFIKAAVEGDWR